MRYKCDTWQNNLCKTERKTAVLKGAAVIFLTIVKENLNQFGKLKAILITQNR